MFYTKTRKLNNMNVEELREYCLSLTQTKENMPWTEPQYSMLATFTVGDKWFCLADLDKKFIDVKCEPNMIAEMQSKYKGAFPAWHMNKEHWLDVKLDSDIPDSIIRSLLKDGYHLIVSKLPRKILEGIRLYK